MLIKDLLFLIICLIAAFIGRSYSQKPNFTCKDGTNISASKFCDGIQDCDGSDEMLVKSSIEIDSAMQTSCVHAQTKFQCLLHRDYICNGTIPCFNTSFCDIGCPSHYKCQDKSCVQRTTACDGNACSGCKEDDEWKTGIGFKCVRHGITCRIPQQLLWDNVQDCDDGSDLCYLSNLTIIDGRDARTFVGATFDRKSCFKCLDGSMIVPRTKLCDGIIDCSDLSDECLCPKTTSSICEMVKHRTQQSSGRPRPENLLFMSREHYRFFASNPQSLYRYGIVVDVKENNRSFSIAALCKRSERRNMRKRANLTTTTESSNVATTSCKFGEVLCDGNNSICLNRSAVCDGVADCPTNTDEKYSFCHGTLPCISGRPDEAGLPCRCSRPCLTVSGTLCNDVADCPVPDKSPNVLWGDPPGFPDDECEARCPPKQGVGCTRKAYYGVGSGLYVYPCKRFKTLSNGTKTVLSTTEDNLIKCDGILTCTADYADENDCSNRFTCPNGTRVNIPLENVCDGFVDCDNKWDENRTTCPERFFCSSLHGRKVSVAKEVVCDFNINCDNGEDEKNCSTSTRFYCENKDPLFITTNKMFDGKGDCSDWSDECPSSGATTEENVLASRYELIGNPFLRVLVWVMSILSIGGNLIVLVDESAKLKKVFEKDESASLRTNHMLVLNLTISDLLMGIYLIMLGISGAMYSGVYCSKSLEWLTSQTCVAMGVLVVLSSETSMFTMLFLTLSRLYSVYRPFSAMSRPGIWTVFLLITCSWFISSIFAFVPLVLANQDVFVEEAWIHDNALFDTDAERVASYTSWPELELFFSTYTNGSDDIEVYRYFSYYSASSACIPNFFVTREDWSWKFSLSLTIINFVIFLVVAAAYILIIVKASGGMTGKNEKARKRNAKMQMKIMRLVATDFCCWIPLCIMVFVNFSGIKVNSIVYAIAAIVLLPINSSLNPLLYSNLIDNILLKLRKPDRRDSTSMSARSARISSAK